MRYLFLVINYLLFVMPVFSIADNQRMLESIIGYVEEQNDSSKFKVLIHFADSMYYEGEISGAASLYELAAGFEENQTLPDASRLALVYGYIGNCLYDLGQYRKSISWFEKSLPFTQTLNDSIELASLYANIGNSYFYMGQYQESINQYHKALRLDRERGDSLNMAICLSNLGKVFHAWKQYPKAIDFFSQALEIGKQKNDSNGISIRLSSMAASYMEMKQFDASLQHYRQAYEIDSLMNNLSRLSGRLDQIGMVYQKKGEYEKAQSFFLRSLEMLKNLEKPRSEAIVLGNLGQNYLLLGELAKAEQLFNQSLVQSKELSLSQSVLNNLYSLSELYEKKGDFKSSKRFLEDYMELKDSLFNAESQKTLSEFQVFYETEKKDNEIRLLSNQKEIQTIQIKRVRQQRLIFLLIASSLLLVAFLLWILFEDRKKSSRILDQKNQELNILNSTKDRFISILAHDLKNPFSAFCNITTALKENFDDLDKSEHRYYIDELTESALRMNAMLKNMLDWASIQMKPAYAELEKVDMNEAVQLMADSLSAFARSRSILLENTVSAGLMALGNSGAIQTVLNNLLTNAIKFSPVNSTVTITGFQEPAGVLFSISDQGVGMTEEELSKLFRIDKDTRSIGRPEGKGTGLGLILCKELMDKMGGSIGVKSTPGKGTEFYFSLKNVVEP